MNLYKLERYSHEGYLIKVVKMALAGEVARELSPIRSWSNNNYDLKLAEKGKGMRVACSGSDVTCHVPFRTTGRRAKDTFHSRSPVTSPQMHMGIFLQESKTRAANKTISMLLSIWLEDTQSHSKPKQRNNCNSRPTLTHHFTYQSPKTPQVDTTKSHIHDQFVYQYCHFLRCDVWNSFIMDPFDKSNRERFIDFISPDERTIGRKFFVTTLFNILAVSNK